MIFALVLCAMLLAFACPATAQGSDCARAATAVERGICGDSHLRKLDASIAADFRTAESATTGATRHALLDQQRRWLQERNRMCATGNPACLLPLYRDRADMLAALTARISRDDPTLDSIAAAALFGSWSVQGYVVPGEPGRQVSATDKPAYLPDAGTSVSGNPGELCSQDGACRSFGLAPKLLAAVTHGKRLADTLHLSPDTPFYLAYLGGKAEYGLIPQPDGSLLAQFILCDATYTRCGYAFQRWLPKSPDAGIRVLAR